jgi:hypothetical protein
MDRTLAASSPASSVAPVSDRPSSAGWNSRTRRCAASSI